MSDNMLHAELLSLAVRMVAGGMFAYFSIRYMVKALDPNRGVTEAAAKKAKLILRRLGIEKNIDLDEHEMRIATLFVPPGSDIDEHIGGHDALWNEINDRVTLPLELMAASKRDGSKLSRLISPPRGVLLYGPPGCGKTLLARAIAQTADARFLNLDLSILTDKWYGESQKLTSALFSVAVKFQPTIIFIDEIDSFLRNRSSTDHESTAIMKAQFMTLWDGFASGNNEVIVLGATNRRNDVDDAILRRMPAQFYVPMPDRISRADILESILFFDTSSMLTDVDFSAVANASEHFAGSDLREACRLAALIRARKNLVSTSRVGGKNMCTADLLEAIKKIKRDVISRNQTLNISVDLPILNTMGTSSSSPSQSGDEAGVESCGCR